jgi:enediyne biosynthesis protein E4
LVAEKYGRAVEQLWDRLNASTNRFQLLASEPLGSVAVADYPEPIKLLNDILVFNPGPTRKTQSLPILMQTWKQWELAQCEFRQIAFTNSSPPASRFYFSAHLLNTAKEQRAILEGELTVQWEASAEQPRIGKIDATAVQIRTRMGVPPFQEVFNDTVKPKEGSYFIDPLMVWDLDHDGSSEIILAAANQVYRGDARQPDVLCQYDPGLIFIAAFGDFTGNGSVDFLCAKFEGLFVYEGTADGRFPDPPRQVWAVQPHLKYAQTIALGDIDGDGDLDIFLGQYKVPYEKGQMPFPYFDANDGFPSYLLENDGKGNFADITLKAGLGLKRGRRVYNASLMDLNRDGALDLVLVSDFAGLDAFAGDGRGHFKDVTTNWFVQREGFGMASCFADFNRDGRMDLLMIGMNSPTADRLASLGLNRPYEIEDAGMRGRTTFGNRLLFGQANGTFQQSAMSEVLARTGWSWGCAAEDYNNDGFPDVYIVNGHESNESVREYEPEFWLHDIYLGNSKENSLAQKYFLQKMQSTRGRGWSYGGYEKNRLFLNLGGTNFLECGWLMDLAMEEPCRNVIAEDLDRDGRSDLIVTTFKVYPMTQQTIHIFRNELPIPKPLVTLTMNNLKGTGHPLDIGPNQVEPLLSSGSYRSQIQPRMRIESGQVSNVVAGLKFQSTDYRTR